jgi:hypothetical protein
MSLCCSRGPREILPIAPIRGHAPDGEAGPVQTTACQFRFGQDRQVCGNRPRRLKTLGSRNDRVVVSRTEQNCGFGAIASTSSTQRRRFQRDERISSTAVTPTPTSWALATSCKQPRRLDGGLWLLLGGRKSAGREQPGWVRSRNEASAGSLADPRKWKPAGGWGSHELLRSLPRD